MTNKQKRAIGYAVCAERRKVQEKIIQLNGWWDDFKKSKYKTMNNYLNYRQKWNNPAWYYGDMKKVIKKASLNGYSDDFEDHAGDFIKERKKFDVVSDCVCREDYENCRFSSELDDYTRRYIPIEEYTPRLAVCRYLECIAERCLLNGAYICNLVNNELFVKSVHGECVYCRVQAIERRTS